MYIFWIFGYTIYKRQILNNFIIFLFFYFVYLCCFIMLVIYIFSFVIEQDKKPKYRDMNIMPVVSSDEEDFAFDEFDFYEW